MTHFEFQEQVPLLALGGLSDEERAQVEQHLATCAPCRALLAEYSFVADEIDAQVPALSVPVLVGTRLMQSLPQTASVTAPARVASPIPVATPVRSPAPKLTPAPVNPSFWRQPVSISRWAFTLALFVLLLLVGVSGVLALQVQRTGTLNPSSLAQLFTSDQRKFVELSPGTNVSANTEGYVYLSPDNPTALLWFTNLKPLDPGYGYQVWLRKDTQRVSGGVFHPDDAGNAMVVLSAPGPLSNYTDIGVTVEPSTGSPGPTTPRVIGGKLD